MPPAVRIFVTGNFRFERLFHNRTATQLRNRGLGCRCATTKVMRSSARPSYLPIAGFHLQSTWLQCRRRQRNTLNPMTDDIDDPFISSNFQRCCATPPRTQPRCSNLYYGFDNLGKENFFHEIVAVAYLVFRSVMTIIVSGTAGETTIRDNARQLGNSNRDAALENRCRYCCADEIISIKYPRHDTPSLQPNVSGTPGAAQPVQIVFVLIRT